jgi:hypothetical protein
MKEKEETNPFSQFTNCYFVAYERKRSPRDGQYAINLFNHKPPSVQQRALTAIMLLCIMVSAKKQASEIPALLGYGDGVCVLKADKI